MTGASWGDDELDPYSQQPYYSPNGFGAETARRLLASVSDEGLEGRWNFSPTARTFLESIARHPQVRANTVGPDLDQAGDAEHVAMSGVLIDDPELVAFTADVALGPTPAWVETLPVEIRREYENDRHSCLRSSLIRQRWIAAQHRYDLHGAVAPPDEIDVVPGHDGTSVLHFWWD